MDVAGSPDIACFACGGRFRAIDGPVHRYMDSTPGCWAAYGIVLAREYESPAYFEVHRLGVDAYAVQHPGKPSSPQAIHSVGVHLIRLQQFLERGLAAGKANDAMLAAARFKHEFVWLEPPQRYDVTVADVVAATSVETHLQAVRDWADAAWRAWSPHHETIRRWAARAVPGGS